MGLVGTVSGGVAGIVLTQRRADRREQQAWDREREREQELWAREDAARTFEHRREAYIDFSTSVKVLATKVFDMPDDPSDDGLDHEWAVEAFRNLQRLEFYADDELSAAACKTYEAVCEWGVKVAYNEPSDVSVVGIQRRYARADADMLRLMRDRLSIPEGNTEPPVLPFFKRADRPKVGSD